MTTPEQILAALQGLDVSNDNHWTADGLPRLDTVRILAGDQTIGRDVVTAAAPGFSRASALQALAPAPPVTPAPAAEPAVIPPAAAATPASQQVQPSVPVADTGLPPLDKPVVAINPRARVPAVDNSDVIEEKQAELAAINEELVHVNRALVECKNRKQVLDSKADDLRLQLDKLAPTDSNQQAITAYLASQRRGLEFRAQQIGAVRKVEEALGVTLKDLVPKRAPIDAVRARKRR